MVKGTNESTIIDLVGVTEEDGRLIIKALDLALIRTLGTDIFSRPERIWLDDLINTIHQGMKEGPTSVLHNSPWMAMGGSQ